MKYYESRIYQALRRARLAPKKREDAMPELMPIVNELESELAEVKEENTKLKEVLEDFGNCSEGSIGFYQEKHRELIKTLTQEKGGENELS